MLMKLDNLAVVHLFKQLRQELFRYDKNVQKRWPTILLWYLYADFEQVFPTNPMAKSLFKVDNEVIREMSMIVNLVFSVMIVDACLPVWNFNQIWFWVCQTNYSSGMQKEFNPERIIVGCYTNRHNYVTTIDVNQLKERLRYIFFQNYLQNLLNASHLVQF